MFSDLISVRIHCQIVSGVRLEYAIGLPSKVFENIFSPRIFCLLMPSMLTVKGCTIIVSDYWVSLSCVIALTSSRDGPFPLCEAFIITIRKGACIFETLHILFSVVFGDEVFPNIATKEEVCVEIMMILGMFSVVFAYHCGLSTEYSAWLNVNGFVRRSFCLPGI